eukprot:5266282-Pleurochrysis_carterae.AAC.2
MNAYVALELRRFSRRHGGAAAGGGDQRGRPPPRIRYGLQQMTCKCVVLRRFCSSFVRWEACVSVEVCSTPIGTSSAGPCTSVALTCASCCASCVISCVV